MYALTDSTYVCCVNKQMFLNASLPLEVMLYGISRFRRPFSPNERALVGVPGQRHVMTNHYSHTQQPPLEGSIRSSSFSRN